MNIVRSDAEKGWERVARSYALETYSIHWSEYWPFLDTYVNLSSSDGLRLLEYYLQQRVLHSQILKSIDQLEKFSSQYLSIEKEKVSNENDLVLNSISQLIQILYSLIDLLNLNDFLLNRHYRSHLESGGFSTQQNQDLISLKTTMINQLRWLSKENQHILSLFNRPLLNSLTMVFTLLISPSGCALIDQIQQYQYELRRSQRTVRPASRLSLIGLICSKRRRPITRAPCQSSNSLLRSKSWPDLFAPADPLQLRRCRSQMSLNQNNMNTNQNNNYSSLSSVSLNDTIVLPTNRLPTTDVSQRSFSISNTPSMFSSQTSVDLLPEDKTKIEKWHYFLAG